MERGSGHCMVYRAGVSGTGGGKKGTSGEIWMGLPSTLQNRSVSLVSTSWPPSGIGALVLLGSQSLVLEGQEWKGHSKLIYSLYCKEVAVGTWDTENTQSLIVLSEEGGERSIYTKIVNMFT